MCLRKLDQFSSTKELLSFYLKLTTKIITKNHRNKHIAQKNDKGFHLSLGIHILVHLQMDHLHYMLKSVNTVLYNA